MFKRIISFFLISSSLFFSSCSNKPSKNEYTETEAPILNIFANATDSALTEGKDMGEEYINQFIFLGESTTSHLKNRGVLSGGTQTTQVWTTKSGTLMLDGTTSMCRIVYPESGEEIDISEAMSRKKPKYMLLTFGLNGAVKNVSRGENYFCGCYKKLISTLQEASPSTKIILQSCFPIAENMDMSNYSVDAKTLNQYIDMLNFWTSRLASELNIGYLNTSEALKNVDGFLYEKYQAGDGYHLTKEAYIEILKYIRTHPINEEEI